MGIDWVTFFAQIVNLFILVWLLKKFLYHPILNAIDKRQAQIAERVQSAKEASEKAVAEYKTYLQKTEEFDKNTQKMFDEASAKVIQYQQEQEAKIHEQTLLLQQKMQTDLEREKESLQLEMRNQIATSFSLVARKVMTDLSGITPIEQAVNLFQNKIRKLDKKQLSLLKKKAKNQKDIYLYSSDSLNKEQTEMLSNFIQKHFDLEKQQIIHFQKNPDLIFGLELVIDDMTLDWNIQSYFEEFDTHLNAVLTGIKE